MDQRIIVAGFGGQGVMLLGQVLSYTATALDLHTVWIPSYGPETRGGTANCSVIISDTPIHSPLVEYPNILLALNEPSLRKFENKVTPGGVIITNSSLIKDHVFRDDVTVIEIPANDMALGLENLKTVNMIMLGAFMTQSTFLSEEAIHKTLEKTFSGAKAALLPLNQQALAMGYEHARSHA